MAIKFKEEEERKLYAGMYFLFKGITLLDNANTGLFERMNAENAMEKTELNEFFEMILKVSKARARIDEYIYTEDETEAQRREKIEEEINQWLEDNVFNEKLRTYLSIRD